MEVTPSTYLYAAQIIPAMYRQGEKVQRNPWKNLRLPANPWKNLSLPWRCFRCCVRAAPNLRIFEAAINNEYAATFYIELRLPLVYICHGGYTQYLSLCGSNHSRNVSSGRKSTAKPMKKWSKFMKKSQIALTLRNFEPKMVEILISRISKFPKYEDFPFDIWLGLFSMRSVCWNDLKPVEVSTRCIVTGKCKLKSN